MVKINVEGVVKKLEKKHMWEGVNFRVKHDLQKIHVEDGSILVCKNFKWGRGVLNCVVARPSHTMLNGTAQSFKV